MATYSHTTFAQAKLRLAGLLGDPGPTFWTDAELGRYLIEALRWWGLVAQYWRETATLELVAGQAFYDIRSTELLDDTLPQSFSVTDREIINDACYQLMEPQIVSWPVGWIGSEMFGLPEIADVLGKSRDDLLRQSGCVVEERTYNVAGGQQRIELDDNTIHIVRGSIEELGDAEDGDKVPLWPMDWNQAQATLAFGAGDTARRPGGYDVSYTPTLAVDLWPPARTQSRVRLYVVRAGAALNPQIAATVVGLPDDFSWAARYRLMDDLLSGDGLSRAPEMARYCQMRWQEGLEALAGYQSLLWSTVGGQRMTISSLGQLDAQRPDWQSTWGTTRSLHLLNWNLFAIYPLPNETQVVTVELVRKAPLPADDDAYIQVGREQMQAIYDYATHVAMFKMQGAEFGATMALYESAKEAAMQYRAGMAALSVNWVQQQRLSGQDRQMRPFKRKGPVVAAMAEAKEAA